MSEPAAKRRRISMTTKRLVTGYYSHITDPHQRRYMVNRVLELAGVDAQGLFVNSILPRRDYGTGSVWDGSQAQWRSSNIMLDVRDVTIYVQWYSHNMNISVSVCKHKQEYPLQFEETMNFVSPVQTPLPDLYSKCLHDLGAKVYHWLQEVDPLCTLCLEAHDFRIDNVRSERCLHCVRRFLKTPCPGCDCMVGKIIKRGKNKGRHPACAL